jgi:hypothetical protein
MADRLKKGGPGRLEPWLRRLAWAAVTLSCLGGMSCTRSYFRESADKEVDAVLREKDKYPKWHIEQYHVYPDPRARFADPTNPDRPPMPPDDPAAHDLSPNPQKPGKAGVARVEGQGYLELLAAWDAQNRAEAARASDQTKAGEKSDAEPERLTVPPKEMPAQGGGAQVPAAPKEKPAVGANEKAEDRKGTGGAASPASTTSLARKAAPGAPQPYLLKLEQTVELGLINSREYQDRREDLYLTALPVTLERFAFAPQVFWVEQAIREWAGRETPTGHQNNWTLNSNVGVAKLFSTGALLLFNFANQTVFNLAGAGTRPLTSQSFINLDLVQPLLRGGGRSVTLEPLTQAERNLLYEIRDFARFREEFYVAIAGGGGGSITGATFQPTGVIAPTPFSPTAGFGTSGLTPGNFGTLPVTGNPGLQVSTGPSGRNLLATAFAAPVSGYLTTLLQAAQIQVNEYNIQKLEGYLQLARAIQEGGDISQLQTDQFEQQVLTRRSTLLQNQQQYLQSLDQFKLQLGLPTNLHIELDDAAFRPLNRQFQKYEDLFNQYLAASEEPSRFGTPEAVTTVRRELRRLFTTSPIVRGTRFRTRIEAAWRAWERLSADQLRQRLADDREERRRLEDKQTDLQAKGEALSAADQRRLDEVGAEIALGEFEQVLREYESQPWKNLAEAPARRRQQTMFLAVVNGYVEVLTQARNERIVELRGSWPDLARLCVNGVDLIKTDLDTAETAVAQTALTNRLDLMNVRAETVDAWRQLAVFANALLGTFNIAYHLDSSTPPGLAQPLLFSSTRTRQELFLNTQLPLVRLPERNNYRAALINFQRARRILQRAEDQVMFDTRSEIRLLRQQEELYRIQQRQVELAYMTVENSLDTFRQPSPVTPAGQPGADLATRAAALTTQLIQAQTSLYQAQIQMTTIWITYLNTRLQLYRDMELMPLDFRGVWIDDVATCECPDGSGRQPGAGPGQSAGERGAPAEPAGDRPERLPEPRPVSRVEGPWLDDSN